MNSDIRQILDEINVKPWIRLAICLFIACICVAAPPGVRAESYRSYADSLQNGLPEGARYRADLESILDTLANSYRASKNTKLLQPSELFAKMARAQAADMLLNDFVGHRSSTGHDFAMRVEVMKPEGLIFRSIAENAARDRQNGPVDESKARRLFQQWMDSRPHRKALLNRSYTYVSTGVAQRGNVICAVQIFWGEPRKPDGVLFQ